jgi:hypothetical protein
MFKLSFHRQPNPRSSEAVGRSGSADMQARVLCAIPHRQLGFSWSSWALAGRRCDHGVGRSVLRGNAASERMDVSWILLGLIFWTLGFLFVLALMRMAGDQDRAARHEQKRMDPFSDVTITRFGKG